MVMIGKWNSYIVLLAVRKISGRSFMLIWAQVGDCGGLDRALEFCGYVSMSDEFIL